MDKEMLTQAVEALLFASGKPINIKTFCDVLECEKEDIIEALQNLEIKLIERNSGIQLIKLEDSYQLATLEIFYDYICKLLDNRPKPNLSQAALEVLAIIAYNPRVTRAEVEKIRGVSSDSAMNKLLEYGLIEEAGKLDAPGRPMTYKTTDEFLRMFGYSSLKDLPELPKLKEELDQIEIEGMEEESEVIKEENVSEEEIEKVKESIENQEPLDENNVSIGDNIQNSD